MVSNLFWRNVALLSGGVTILGLALYPIIVDPYLNPEKWNERQKIGRAGAQREKMQPGNMKVWTDPFEKKK